LEKNIKKLLTFYEKYVRILIELILMEVEFMDYERIILELLGRIQVLKEKVDILEKTKNEKEGTSVTTIDICRYIMELKVLAKEEGKSSIILISRDIHRQLKLKSRFPMVCNAMRQCMREKDTIIFQPPKGNSSTLEIEYKL
jgi:hypothetical protein